MKELIILSIVAWMLGAIAETESYGNRQTADLSDVQIQSQTSGVDSSYVHGTWCVDERSF